MSLSASRASGSSVARLLLPALLAALVLALVGLPGRAQAADAGLDQAQQKQQEAGQKVREAQAEESRIRTELDAVVLRLSDAEAEEGRTSARLAEAEQQVQAAKARVSRLTDVVDSHIRAAYTSGSGTDLLAVMVSSDDPDSALDRLALLGAVSRHDGTVLREASAAQSAFEGAEQVASQLRTEAADQRAAVAVEQTKVTELLGQAEAAKKTQEAALQDATADVIAETERIAKEEAARRAAEMAARSVYGANDGGAGAAVAQQVLARGGFACYVGPSHSFADSYGAPRSGGRSHQGVDTFAPYGSGVYATESGVITRSYSNTLGGLSMYLQGDSGVSYYMAHQSRNIATSGQRVEAGQLIGLVGTSGNAAGTPPHVHFEVHPGGGGAVNPTPFARAVCG